MSTTTSFSSFDAAQAVLGGGTLFDYDASGSSALAAPIILDLDHDGETVVPLSDSSTLFDTVGDGLFRRTAWVDPGDALLVRDRNGDGLVNDIRDISFVADKPGSTTDLGGLAAFDDNGDGVLDGADASFAGFSVWIDTNSNGVTDTGELLSLTKAGISSIGLSGTSTGKTAAQRAPGESVTFNTASFHRTDGSTGSLGDVGLAYDTTPLGKAGPGNVAFSEIDVDEDRKSKQFRIAASDGGLFVRPHHAKGDLDPGAGKVGSAALLAFADHAVGLLDPIILDLDGDGLEVKSRKKARASFDMDGDGVADDTGWIGKGEGFLVLDKDDDGQITTPAELSFLGEKAGLASAFAGLGTLDTNKDNKIDKSDARFVELKVWVDKNGDGTVDPGELKTLADLGITSLSLTTTALSKTAKLGDNIGLMTSTFTRVDGSTGSMGEAALAFAPSSLIPTVPEAPSVQLAGITTGLGSGSTSTASATAQATAPLFSEMASDGSSARSKPEIERAKSWGGQIVPRFRIPAGLETTSVQLQAARLVEAIGAFGIIKPTSETLLRSDDMRENSIVFAPTH